MGFGLNQLKASAADQARAAQASAQQEEEAPETAVSAAPQSPASQASPATARPNLFARPANARPSFSPPAPAEQVQAAAPAPAPAAVPAPPASTGRPSFQVGRPAAAAPAPVRPALNTPVAAPNARGVFVRNPNKQPGISSASSQSQALSPQALFEIVCTYRQMSESTINAARIQMRLNPDEVISKLRRIYDEQIAPARAHHASDLPNAKEQFPDKVIFLVRKEDKEKLRAMTQEEARASGQTLLDGAVVESIHAAASPFSPPSVLFSSKPLLENEAAPVQSDPAPRSPRP